MARYAPLAAPRHGSDPQHRKSELACHETAPSDTIPPNRSQNVPHRCLVRELHRLAYLPPRRWPGHPAVGAFRRDGEIIEPTNGTRMKTIYILDDSEVPAGISAREIEQTVAAQLGRGVILLTDSPSALLDALQLPGDVSGFAGVPQ